MLCSLSDLANSDFNCSNSLLSCWTSADETAPVEAALTVAAATGAAVDAAEVVDEATVEATDDDEGVSFERGKETNTMDTYNTLLELGKFVLHVLCFTVKEATLTKLVGTND